MVPAQRLAGQGDFVLAERRAVAFFLALLVRRAVTDDGLAADEARAVGDLAGGLDGGLHGFRIVPVDLGDHMPAVGLEAFRGVVEEPGRCVAVTADLAVDRDVVVVVDRDQLAQAQRAGQRAGLMRDAFHETAVAEEDIGEVVDDVVAGLVELRGQRLLRQGHADGIGDALAERAGGGFHARGVAVFRMPGGLGVKLTELLEVLDPELISRQVEQGVDQHRAVAVRQHEAVPVGPGRISRIVRHEVVPEHLGDIGHAHRRTRVTRIGLLDRIHRERSYGIGKIFT